MTELGGGWDDLLSPLFSDDRYKKIREFLKNEYSRFVVYPSMYDIYNCFRFTPVDSLKCVLLGQDPYHEPGQAHGLCFSVPRGVPLPPSLENIFKEIENDLGIVEPGCGDLTKWAREGVLLLNTTLTVRKGAANSHASCGWAWFTDSVIKLVSDMTEGNVFMLWGNNARTKVPLIDRSKHLVLETVHPSPLSAYRGFFGCGHFSKANEYLESHGKTPVNWDLN
ncbi:MAG: uracil-DNA glycosylase [Clostridia bacterium]|nr:uracil-DNA glycosylase [Clostridia bacterium]